LDYVYLGYWIKDSRKMSYKTQYQPAQGLQNGSWEILNWSTSSTRTTPN